MRGGQVTIFVAVGLVILFIVAIFFLVLDTEQRVQQEYEQGQQIIEGANAAELSAVLGSCIDTVVIDEFKKLGQSGGLHVDDPAYPRAIVGSGPTTRLMLYGLTRNRDIPGSAGLRPYRNELPDYPHEDFTVENTLIQADTGNKMVSWQPGYFGDVNFAPICDKQGPNRPGSTRECRSFPGSPPSVPNTESTQNMLMPIIANRVQACANPARFSEALGVDVTEVGEPTAEIAYTFNNVIVSVYYPLTIVGQAETNLQEVRRTYDFRYMQIAQYARDLALRESRDIAFDISEDYREVPSWKPGFTVQTSEVDSVAQTTLSPPIQQNGETATMVTIIDSKSELDGVSYTFSFLMEHREPVVILSDLSCAYLQSHSATELLSDGVLEGIDPDGYPVSINWCHDISGAVCGVDLNMTVSDTDGWMDSKVVLGCPVSS